MTQQDKQQEDRERALLRAEAEDRYRRLRQTPKEQWTQDDQMFVSNYELYPQLFN